MATVTWATTDDVASALGLDVTGVDPIADPDRLTHVTAAANDWAYEKRAGAGYTDNPATVPSTRVLEGIVKLAAAAYRERGMYGGPAGFSDAEPPALDFLAAGLSIKAWIGVPRPWAV